MVIDVSVVIPAYNIALYIQRCLESVTEQTLKNIEVIVVDDGSTDNTVDVVRECMKRDRRIRLFQKENGGVTSARLLGVREAIGEYIGFVDGDDWIEPDMYENLLKNAILYHADISHCGYQMVFLNHVDYYYNTGRLVQQDQLTGLKDLLSGSFIEPGLCNKLFRRALLHSLLNEKKMDESIKNTEDLLMNYYLFEQSKKSVYIDICYYHYMIREESAATGTISEHRMLDPLRVSKILLEETKGNHELNNIVCNRLTLQLITNATMESRVNPQVICSNQKEARKELRVNFFFYFRGCNNRTTRLKLVLGTWCPTIYMFIHKVYAHITGSDEKYSIE